MSYTHDGFRCLKCDKIHVAERPITPANWPICCGAPTWAEGPLVNEEQMRHYFKCRKNGCSHKLAEMLAIGQPPGSNTDKEFLEGRENGRQFQDTPELGDHYARVARAHGQSTTGKVYLSGLAEFPGDPRAWVSGRGDVQRVVEERGWGCEGAVHIKPTWVAEPSGGGIAKELVDDELRSVLERVPDPAHVDIQDLREQIVERRAPYWSKQEVA